MTLLKSPLAEYWEDRLDGECPSRIPDSGYIVLPEFLPLDLVDRLKSEADVWVDGGYRAESIARCLNPDRIGPPPLLELEMEAHGELLCYPPLMSLMEQLMGPDFAFHHMHSDRQPEGFHGKPWHHDYEQLHPAPRTHTMVHALHYLGGLDGGTSALAVLPGSHQRVAAKNALAHLGTETLPGEVVLEDLPVGSTVLIHSAVFHARRPPAAGRGRARYMVDASYCQTGITWPSVKPYWRYILQRGRELELDQGRWPELLSERHFAEYSRSR